MEKCKIEIPKQLEGLLGPPPLLEGEDREAYLALRSLVIEEAQPKTVTDWVDVHDFVTQLWEEQHFRRASVAIIRGGMLSIPSRKSVGTIGRRRSNRRKWH